MAGTKLTQLKLACSVFIDGVERTAVQTGLRENIGIVEFGQNTRIVQSLTNDYGLVRRKVNGLSAGGGTPMAAGLREALKEILTNGGPVNIKSVILTPRIILVTDGQPTTDDKKLDAKTEVLVHALVFGPKSAEVGLPYPVPICTIGIGSDCDEQLLMTMAKGTNGIYKGMSEVSELGDFFRQQVLLILFIVRFAEELEALTNALILQQFFEEMGQSLSAEEAAALIFLLRGMSRASGPASRRPEHARITYEGGSSRPTPTQTRPREQSQTETSCLTKLCCILCFPITCPLLLCLACKQACCGD